MNKMSAALVEKGEVNTYWMRPKKLRRLLAAQFDCFKKLYHVRHQTINSDSQPIVEQSMAAFLQCGDLNS